MRTLLICSFFLFPFIIVGQLPCAPFGNNPPGDEPPGCFICSSTVISSNAGATPDTTDYESCLTQENSVWVNILADSSGALSATFLASDCQTGDGIEMAIYDDEFNCLGVFDQVGAITGNVQVGGLVAGKKYLIQLDGVNGDVCDFTLVVTGGGQGTQFPPFIENTTIDSICIGDTICYQLKNIDGATMYEWDIQSSGHQIVSGGAITDSQVCLFHEVAGEVQISVKPSNECFPGVPVDSTFTVGNCISNLNNSFLEKQVELFPNPTDGWLNIETDLQVESVEIYDLSGRFMKTELPTEIDVSICQSGIYILKIFTPQGVVVKKFIKN